MEKKATQMRQKRGRQTENVGDETGKSGQNESRAQGSNPVPSVVLRHFAFMVASPPLFTVVRTYILSR